MTPAGVVAWWGWWGRLDIRRLGLASLWDAGRVGWAVRGCRRVAPQPPANGCEPSGFGDGGFGCFGEIYLVVYLNGHPGGMLAMSRGLSEQRATPPEIHPTPLDPSRGRRVTRKADKEQGRSRSGGFRAQ